MAQKPPRALPERDIQRRGRQRMLGTMDLRENAVDARVLRGHASDNTQRAVETNHIKTNQVDNRILKTDGDAATERAVSTTAIRTNAVDSRTLASHASDDAQRAVNTSHLKNALLSDGRLYSLIDRPSYATGTGQIRALHQDVQIRRPNLLGKLINNDPLDDNAVDGRVLASGSTDAERAVNTPHVKDNAVTSRVLASHTSDDTQRAVNSEHIKTDAVTAPKVAADSIGAGHLKTGSVTSDKVAANAIRTSELAAGAVDTGNLLDGAVHTAKLASASVTSEKIAAQAVRQSEIAANAVGLSEIAPSATNPAQGTGGLRTIGSALGGDSLAAAAGNHSHGSGNSIDFDLLPQTHQDRILLARQRVRGNIQNIPSLTRDQLNLYLRELSIVALAALNLEIEAPDLTAEQRVNARKAGTPYPLFTEWRLAEGQTLHDASQPRYTDGLPDVGTVPS